MRLNEGPTAERLATWKALTGHLITLTLTVGFFGIVFTAMLGLVDLKDPTTATFVGTVTGYAIAQLTRPMAWYFADLPGIDRRLKEEPPAVDLPHNERQVHP